MSLYKPVVITLALVASSALSAQSPTPTPPGPATGKVTTSPPGPPSPVQKAGKKNATPHKADIAKDDHATIEKIPPANPADH